VACARGFSAKLTRAKTVSSGASQVFFMKRISVFFIKIITEGERLE